MKLKIGSRLKRMRIEKSLTQKELAVKVSGGLDYTYIGKIERGEQLPSLKILLKISDALSVPVAFFFQDESAATADDMVSGLDSLTSIEAGRQLVQALWSLDQDDFPLVTEIIQILGKHRNGTKKEQLKMVKEKTTDWPIAAETMTGYKKDKK